MLAGVRQRSVDRSGDRVIRSAQLQRAAKPTLRVDDFAARARGHALAETGFANLLNAAEFVRIVHKDL